MIKTRSKLVTVVSAILLFIASSILLTSQNTGRRAAPVIHDAVDENKLVTLAGNTRSEANADNDLGPAADSFAMNHMMMHLKRSPEQEQAAAKFVAELNDPKSPNFHKWLTAEEFGKNFGVAESDIKTITLWLESHGFKVNEVYSNGMMIDFSGTAGQVARAFHTTIHNLDVNGVRHVANFGDPQIPAALAPAVTGIISLHDFHPHSMAKPKYTYAAGRTDVYALVPADLATIYDFTPLFSKGNTGSGQTIAVLEDTDLYSATDWNTFRSTFGLAQYGGTLTTVHPSGVAGNCSDPGVNADGDDFEATIDAEWATAAAPGAGIQVAACDNTFSNGQFIAMLNLISGANPPAIISNSYGVCETENGSTGNAAVSALYQQAVAEGVSIFVAAGDSGGASCDQDVTYATHGITVNGWASTIYNVAAGGTDFSDTLDGTNAQYWSKTNSSTYASAMSYIPEIPWNNSCANSLLAGHFSYSAGYGANGFCASAQASNLGLLTTGAGSGGPSNCSSGASATPSVANGTCKGLAKPSWQTGVSGIPNDGVRDLPDVSMFASVNPVWGHYYVICFSDQDNGGAPCRGTPSNWGGAGGTSFVAPILAGVQALVNQSQGGPQGNPNPVYYGLAAGSNASSIFHSITRGDIAVNCLGTTNCYGSTALIGWGREGRGMTAGAEGALSTTSGSYTPAFAAGASWNFATGLGSLDVANLVNNWGSQ
jgi:subtilase family serine protease